MGSVDAVSQKPNMADLWFYEDILRIKGRNKPPSRLIELIFL